MSAPITQFTDDIIDRCARFKGKFFGLCAGSRLGGGKEPYR